MFGWCRTLTPFGFQAEERTLWEATDTYINMSPYLQAHKIKKPLLLIHGEDDNNTGVSFFWCCLPLWQLAAGLAGIFFRVSHLLVEDSVVCRIRCTLQNVCQLCTATSL